MYLTEFQKKILNEIFTRKIYDVYSYLDYTSNFNHEFFEEELLNGILPKEYEPNLSSGVYIVLSTLGNKISNEFFEFIGLCQSIEKAGLIHTTKMPFDRKWYFPVIPAISINENKFEFEDEFNWSDDIRRINQILYERYLWEFFPYPELKDFIENNYKTKYEILAENEDKDRKNAQKLTLKIALISIILSSLISVSGSIFNYLTYDKKREVEIKNVNAFPESTKVYLNAPLNRIFDTVKIYDTIKTYIKK